MNQDFLWGMSRYLSVVFLSPGNLDVNNHKPCGLKVDKDFFALTTTELANPRGAKDTRPFSSFLFLISIAKTRMHSSGMRTVRCSSRLLWGGVCPGVSTHGSVC